jgi:hypothetical protein
LSLTLENLGKVKLTGKVSKGGLTGTAFSVTAGTGAFTLAHNQTTTVSIKFAPTAAAEFLGNMTISSNDPTNGAVQVSLSGTGVSGTLMASISALSFAPVKAGKSAALKMTIKNMGLGVLHGSVDATSKMSKPFSTSGAGKFTLADKASRVVTITFAPKKAGTFTGTMLISSDDTAQAGVPLSIPVMGTSH